MPLNKNELFKELLNNFLAINNQIEAIIVSDEDGLIIAGEKRKDIDVEIISFLTAVINPIIERIRNEFAFKKFGTANFDTDDHRLLFISVDEQTTLSLVFENMASIDKLSPYAYFLAEKIAQILEATENDELDLSLPNFKWETDIKKGSGRLKNQIYQNKLDHGGMYRFKFIIIGEHEVGKTSIVRRFVEGRFLADYRATIGLNIVSHEFEAFGNKISLSLWDIGAQQYFQRYRKTYYNGAQAAFIVFDLTNRKTFDNVTTWHNELKEFIKNKDIPVTIVGNKNDLNEKRTISYEEGVKLASLLSELSEFSGSSHLSEFSDLSELTEQSSTKISYIETSALTGDHIEDAFSLISYHFMIKSWEIEENRMKKAITDEIELILDDKKALTLTFITEDPMWSPGLQILSEIRKIEPTTKVKEKKSVKIIQYQDGLTLKSCTFNTLNISGTDGIFLIFDARKLDKINPKWREMILFILEKIKKNKIILIGIRISEKIDWSGLMEELDVSDLAEDKLVSLLYFKIGSDYRLEIFEQLEIMLNTIKNLTNVY